MNNLFGWEDQPKPQPSPNKPTIRADGQFACAICGGPAHFGFGVKLRANRLGRWACRDHVAAVKAASPHDKGN
jgi:hypothetical protein